MHTMCLDHSYSSFLPSSSYPPPPPFMPFFSLHSSGSKQCCHTCMEMHHPLESSRPAGTTLLRKTDALSQRSHQLTTDPQLEVGAHEHQQYGACILTNGPSSLPTLLNCEALTGVSTHTSACIYEDVSRDKTLRVLT